MLSYISDASWQLILTWLLPPAGALLSAIALWVASLARSTSKDVLSMSSDQERALSLLLERPTRNASPSAVRVRRKSSTKGTIST